MRLKDVDSGANNVHVECGESQKCLRTPMDIMSEALFLFYQVQSSGWSKEPASGQRSNHNF